jgi:hypothetical protein
LDLRSASHGKQTELLDLIERLLGYSRALSADAEVGENELWREAVATLDHYNPAAKETSSAAP